MAGSSVISKFRVSHLSKTIDLGGVFAPGRKVIRGFQPVQRERWEGRDIRVRNELFGDRPAVLKQLAGAGERLTGQILTSMGIIGGQQISPLSLRAAAERGFPSAVRFRAGEEALPPGKKAEIILARLASDEAALRPFNLVSALRYLTDKSGIAATEMSAIRQQAWLCFGYLGQLLEGRIPESLQSRFTFDTFDMVMFAGEAAGINGAELVNAGIDVARDEFVRLRYTGDESDGTEPSGNQWNPIGRSDLQTLKRRAGDFSGTLEQTIDQIGSKNPADSDAQVLKYLWSKAAPPLTAEESTAMITGRRWRDFDCFGFWSRAD